MISFAVTAVTAKLICVFVFAYADCWFSHSAAQLFCVGETCSYHLILIDLSLHLKKQNKIRQFGQNKRLVGFNSLNKLVALPIRCNLIKKCLAKTHFCNKNVPRVVP